MRNQNQNNLTKNKTYNDENKLNSVDFETAQGWNTYRNNNEWEVAFEEGRGRFLVAKRNFEAGEIVLEEDAFSWALLPNFVERVCSYCVKTRITEYNRKECKTCKQVIFCSEQCFQAGSPLHKLECESFTKIASSSSDADPALLKIACSAVCQSLLKDQKNFEEALALNHHADEFQSEWTCSMNDAFTPLVGSLPKTSEKVDADFLTKICCRVNVNSFALKVPFTQSSVGIGLFPIASLMNHSCQPTCIFSNIGTKLYIRTLVPVAKGEELTISYIDLYQSRQERKEELRNTKFFDCLCKLCSTPISQAKDRFISGYLCLRKGCKGVMVSSNESLLLTCDECGTKSNADVYLQVESRVKRALSNADRMRCLSDPEEASLLLEGLFNTNKEKDLVDVRSYLHPHHSLLFYVHFNLINIYNQCEDQLSAIWHCGKVISCMKSIYPPNYDETSNHYHLVGILYEELSNKASTNSSANSYMKRSKSAFRVCWEMRKVCYGENHPETQKVEVKYTR